MAKRASASYTAEEWKSFFWKLYVKQGLTITIIAQRKEASSTTVSARFKSIEAHLIDAQSKNSNAIFDEAKARGVSPDAADAHFSKIDGYVSGRNSSAGLKAA